MRWPPGQHDGRLPRRRGVGLAWTAVLALVVAAPPAGAADQPTPREVRQALDEAARLLDEDQPAAAVAALAGAVRGLEALARLPKPPSGLRVLTDRAETLRRSLERAGADVATIALPRPRAPVAAAPRPAAAAPAAPSFSRQVAPILVRSCGACHVADRKGNFQMASYDALLRSGMVQRGNGQASRIVEVILTGDMPRGGGRVSAEDVATLVKWIDAGAACDAADPTVSIDVVARGGGAPPNPAPDAAAAVVAMPLRPGDVSFAADIAPLVLEQCSDCHGSAKAEAGLRMTSLEALLRGGRSGTPLTAGRGAESLLVKKLRGVGIEGQRMPLGRPPLPDDRIALVQKWIDQGARLDVLTSRDPLETVAAAGRARSMSAAELEGVRFRAGGALWKRALPDEEPVVEIGTGICLIGNLPAESMERLAALAADVAERVRADLVARREPLLKGGIVLFVFRRSFDYSAFWQTILEAERPRGIVGHAGVSGDVAYGALLVPTDDEPDTLRLLLAEQVTGAALAGRSAPAWFCRGAGRSVAQRLVPRADLVKEWKRDLPAAVRQLGSAQDFLAGHGDGEAAARVAGGFVGAIAPPARLAQFVALLDSGTRFDDAFAKVFRQSPAQAFQAWAARPGR